MPFVARHTHTQTRVCVWDYPDPRQDLREQLPYLVCPLCESPFYLRMAFAKATHFVHKTICPYAHWSHPETPEHRAFKQYVHSYLQQDPFWGTAHLEYEVPLPAAQRVADVLAVFDAVWKVAHECQLSDIGRDELDRRTTAYLNNGIDVVWWFGAQLLKRKQWLGDWLLKHQGVILTAEITLRAAPSEALPVISEA